MAQLKNKAAVVGVGSSDYAALYRTPDPARTAVSLGFDAMCEAAADAGLALADIDGLILSGVTDTPAQYADFAYRAGMRTIRYLSPNVQSGRLAAPLVAQAAAVLDAGMANCVACIYATTPRSRSVKFDKGVSELYDPVFGMASPGAQYAMLYSRYLDTFGYLGRHEPLQAAVPIAFRKHAALNPVATMRKPLTVDDYLAAPYVARPLRRFDYCLVSDGAVCLIMTRADRARDLKRPPVYLSAFSNHLTLTETYVPADGPGQRYFSYARTMINEIKAEAGIGLADIDALQVYDNFTCDVLWSLEGAGFCEPGEALDWVQGGRIELGGELPTNTAGGMMSEAYMMGWNNLAEAVRQLRHECGDRQVRDCEHVLYACLAGQSNMALFSRHG